MPRQLNLEQTIKNDMADWASVLPEDIDPEARDYFLKLWEETFRLVITGWMNESSPRGRRVVKELDEKVRTLTVGAFHIWHIWDDISEKDMDKVNSGKATRKEIGKYRSIMGRIPQSIKGTLKLWSLLPHPNELF
jgi:hypothetical protein